MVSYHTVGKQLRPKMTEAGWMIWVFKWIGEKMDRLGMNGLYGWVGNGMG